MKYWLVTKVNDKLSKIEIDDEKDELLCSFESINRSSYNCDTFCRSTKIFRKILNGGNVKFYQVTKATSAQTIVNEVELQYVVECALGCFNTSPQFQFISSEARRLAEATPEVK